MKRNKGKGGGKKKKVYLNKKGRQRRTMCIDGVNPCRPDGGPRCSGCGG